MCYYNTSDITLCQEKWMNKVAKYCKTKHNGYNNGAKHSKHIISCLQVQIDRIRILSETVYDIFLFISTQTTAW